MCTGAQANTKTVILNRISGSVIAETDTVSVVSCDVTKRFWVSWVNGLVEVGAGHVGSGTILAHQLPTPMWPVNALGLGGEWQVKAEWEILASEGNYAN